MAYDTTQLPDFIQAVEQAVRADDLRRSDWRRQTDAVRIAAIVAQMSAEPLGSVILVDGRIETSMITAALRSGSIKQFFNRRCHDLRLKCRRLIVLDTKSTKGWDGRNNGKANLHFHGAFLLTDKQNEQWLRKGLRRVFGEATALGPLQFRLQKPDLSRHFTFANRQASGIAGKVCYMLSHAGSTHLALGLNEGQKRSRRAPASRRRYNSLGQGLAAGVPSNFLAQALICDNESKREAGKAFEDWRSLEKANRREARRKVA